MNTRIRRSLAVAAAAALALILPSTAAAETTPKSPVSSIASAGQVKSKVLNSEGSLALPTSGQAQSTCPATKRNLPALRKAGKTKAICFEWKPAKEISRKSSAPTSPIWCSLQADNTVFVTRWSICSHRVLIIVVVNIDTGMVLGNAEATIEQEIDTSNSNVEYSEYFKFELKSSDVVSDTMTAEITSICNVSPKSTCKQGPGPWTGPKPVTIGVPMEGHWLRTWMKSKMHDVMNMEYTIAVSIPGATIGTASWGGLNQPGAFEYAVRCDNEVGKYAGCIVPSFTPTYTVDSKYNLSRQYIGMVQASMSTHPGWEGHGEPLHREANEKAARDNRNAICDGTFKANPTTPPPAQCDEWPFAKSKESGGSSGAKGSSCQQYAVITETLEGEVYTSLTWPGLNQGKMPPANAKCARASMPKVENEGVGGGLGRVTTDWRLIDGDAYWVDAGNG